MVDTIENNIKFERNVDENQFKTICSICEIDKIIKSKFDCFDTLICESSDNISGGEKQRIALARGLINSGKIIIMDESLSEVGEKEEIDIINKVFKKYNDKTIIYISHRKSIIDLFNERYRLERSSNE